MQVGTAHRLVGHGKAAKVEDFGVFNDLVLYFLRLQHHIRTGIAVEAEIPITVCIGMDNRQRGMNAFIVLQTGGVDTGLHKAGSQLLTEAVLAHLTDKCGFMTHLA